METSGEARKQRKTEGRTLSLEYLRPAAEALARLHRSGRVHGRICPETVMVSRRIFFCFPLPETIGNRGKEDQRFFTALSEPEGSMFPADARGRGYIPLEQRLKEERTVPASDVYSLCAVFYYMLTGCEPTDIESRIRGEKLPLPSALGAGMPKWQEAALMKGLSEMEKDRYADAAELYQALYGRSGDTEKTASVKLSGSVQENKPLSHASAHEAFHPGGRKEEPESGNHPEKGGAASEVSVISSGNVMRSDWKTGLARYMKKIRKIVFRSTAFSLPFRKWDISREGDGTVTAWLENEGNLLEGTYVLCIFGNGSGVVDAPENSEGLFAGFENLEAIDFNRNFFTHNTTNMKRMFEGDYVLKYLYGFDCLDTSRVTNMSQMFSDCWNLDKVDLSGFDTSQVTDMSAMFQNCGSMTELDVSGFDTSGVTDMSYMFYRCRRMEKLDISGFDMSRVKNRGRMLTGTRWE